MQVAIFLLTCAGIYPFFRAWQANKHTPLVHAIAWAFFAWLGWGAALLLAEPSRAGMDRWRYVALCLTGAAGVAVLGARRPQAGAWNLVVVGLLAVMLLPLGENFFLGNPSLDGPRTAFMVGTLAVGILNYLRTRLALPALVLAASCGLECLVVADARFDPEPRIMEVVHVSLLTAPWLAMAMWRLQSGEAGTMNCLWRDFRDRYGVFWAQRVREQYNRGAVHARLPGRLHWHGWENDAGGAPLTPEQSAAMQALLRTLLKRFNEG